MHQARSTPVSRRFSRIATSLATIVVLCAVMGYGLLTSVSAVPSTMNFQGRLTDASGNTMPDGLYNMQFKLFTASSGGSSVWDETRETTARVQVTNGLFATKLGEVTPIPASLFASGSLYFEITMATPGTATCSTASCASWESPMTPRQQMSTSAYAFQAENANSLGGVDSANFARRDTSNTFTGSTQVFQNTTNSTTAFQVQNAAGISLLGVDTVNNQLTIRGFDDNFTRGPELITDGDFSGAAWTASGWTTSTTDATSSNLAGTATLSTNQFTVIPGDYYQVRFTIEDNDYPSDCVQASIGNSYGDDDFCGGSELASGTDTLIIQASDADPLTFWTYSSEVTVSNVSVRHLTYAPSGAAIALQNAQGDTTLEIRTGGLYNSNGYKASNTFIGLSSGENNIDGYSNTALGNNALQANTSGETNTAVGNGTLQSNTIGYGNSAYGVESMNSNTSGIINSAFGMYSLHSNINGQANVSIGYQSLTDNTYGSYNTAIGTQSLNDNISGNGNVGIGYRALNSNITGSNNLGLGYSAGHEDLAGWTSGSGLTNATAIGAFSQVQANNSIVLGSVDYSTKVGIGITVPSNMFSVSGKHYSTGTATRTSGSAVVTGTSTSWTSAMVGDIIIFADGMTKQVSSVASTTSLTMNSNSNTTDVSPTEYRMHYPGFQVSSNGDTWVQKTSTTAFRIQNSLGATSLFTADTTNSRIQIGSSTTDATGMVFALDSFNQATDPTGINGAMYYNTNLNKLRCYQNGAWTDCITAAGSGANTNLSNIASTNLSAALNTTAGNLTLQTTTSGNIILNAVGTTELMDDTNVGGNLTVAASKSLTLAGGNTASRPVSPTEGMLYYDTTTKQLLTYANAKWQADRTTATKIVAMGAPAGCTGTVPVASQNYDAADYVVNSCTSAQTTINAAIAALPATGGTVYLMEGTYIIDGAITPSTKTRLVGAGPGTAITLKNAINANINAVQVSSAHEVNIEQLAILGNKANNTSGTQNGISISTSGSATQTGTVVNNVTISSFRDQGVTLVTGKSSRVTNSTIISNSVGVMFNAITEMTVSNNTIASQTGDGIQIYSSNSTVSGNTLRANSNGIYIQGGSRNTISGNTIVASTNTVNGAGIDMWAAGENNVISGNTITGGAQYGIGVRLSGGNQLITGNTIEGNVSHGVFIATTHNSITGNLFNANGGAGVQVQSDNNVVSENKIHTSGGATANNGITLSNADNNKIGNNTITDTSCTTTCYAINILNAGADNNYLVGNTYSTTSGTATINDVGTGTVYSNQSKTAGGLDVLFKQANSSSAFQIQNASSIPVFTVNTSGNNIALGTGTSLTLTGGNTTSRPASPTEGMMYYDTDTKQLLTYTNGKWQADRSDSVLVAASNSSVADKASADYVGDGNTGAALDGDQVQINQALAAGLGKKVVLLAGTYSVDESINVPNNTTLAGVGTGSVITVPNALNTSFGIIRNTDVVSGTGVTIRDLLIDGNMANQSGGSMIGISFDEMGDGAGPSLRPGGLVTGVAITEMTDAGLSILRSNHSVFTANRIYNNVFNVYSSTSNYNTISNNSIVGSDQSGGYGVYLDSSDDNTLTGNVIQGNAEGIAMSGADRNAITGNNINDSTLEAIYVASSSNMNKITSNSIYNSGGATLNNAIYVTGSDTNTISDNSIRDISCTTSCHAINIVNVSADNNYISGNTYSTTSGTATINNAGTGTIFGGQVNGSTDYMIQPAGTIELMKNTNVTGTLTVSGATTFNGSLAVNSTAVYKNTSDSTTAFQIQNAATTALFVANTSNMRIEIASGAEIKLMGVGNTYNGLTKDFTCSATEAIYDIVIVTGSGTVGQAGGGATNSRSVAGVVVAKPNSTTCTLALEGTVQVDYGSATVTIGDTVVTSGAPGDAMTSATPNAGADIGKAISAKDGSNLGWVLLN